MPTQNVIDSQLNHSNDSQGMQKLQRLWLTLAVRILFLLIQLGVGFWSGSLSLMASAGHLFTDIMTLGLTLIAAGVVQRQTLDSEAGRYRRLEAWVALLNSASLAAIAVLIAWEAIQHLQHPQPISGLPVLVVAGLNLVINSWIVQLLQSDSHHDLNVRGVFLHGLADATSSIALILSACAIYFLDWFWADAVASLLVALLICLSALTLMKAGWQLLQRESTQHNQEDTLA